jgi:hypothetical protein
VITEPRAARGLRQTAREAVRLRLLALLDLPVLERRQAHDGDRLARLAEASAETRALAEEALRVASLAPAAGSSPNPAEAAWRAAARPIEDRHQQQTVATVEALRARYAEPVFGEVAVFDLIERLAQCVDPTDCRLFGASQLTHVLQMIEAMDRDGVLTPDLLLAALVHDLGKLLLLTDEDPANVVCMNAPIGEFPDGIGLDNVVIQWNHDEFGYSRLVGLVPDHISWLVRYHSLDPVAHRPLMDERDRCYADEHLETFFHYDHDTKSAFHVPRIRVEDFREVVEAAFPTPISF